MEESRKRDRGGQGRLSEEQSSRSGRRPGEELSPSVQPREKIRRPGPSGSNDNCSTSGGGSTQQPNRNQRRNFLEIVESRPKLLDSKCGESGKVTKLTTNYFRLLKKPNWCIYMYRVDFEPTIELIRFRRGLLYENRSTLGTFLFDGTVIHTLRELPERELNLNTTSRNNEQYCIKIKYVGTIERNKPQSLPVLNLILRGAMQGLNLQLIDRNYYDPAEKISIDRFRIQLWPGYTTSIRQNEQDVLVNAEIKHRTMRTETVYDMMRSCISDARDRGWQETFKLQIIGVTVSTNYNNMMYRIDDVDFGVNPENCFDLKKTGEKITFVNYYQQKYRIRIRDTKQPLLMTKTKDKKDGKVEEKMNLLIPELCQPTGMTDEMRKNFGLMREMANFTKSEPRTRIDKLVRFNRRLQNTAASLQILNDWQMQLDKELVTLNGRILDDEKISFMDQQKNNQPIKTKKIAARNGDWTSAFRECGMFTHVKLKHWILIVPSKSLHPTRNFIETIRKVAFAMNMEIRQPFREITLTDDRSHSYDSALNQAANEDPQLIMCVVPNDNQERYTTIKKFCCIRREITSQVLAFKTVAKNNMSVATKVAIQLNAKLGGAPWMISLPMEGLMTIGYDTCRSTKDKSKAYASLVATMDQKVKVRYFSIVSECSAFDSLANNFISMITVALHEYRKEHNMLPKRIIIYRDSVGDGSLSFVYEHEVKELIEHLKKLYEDSNSPHNLKIAFIVVSKKINTKFFQGVRNPPPGTVVDDVVTIPERYDFFLVSQSVRQGCVSPTYYNVLYDTTTLKPDRLQILTYKLCHLYYNWSGTTRVPAVCQYARKLSSLVATNLHQIPTSTMLGKTLYYL